MAEFLLDVRSDRPINSIKEYGDIICVRPDGFKWSESEKPKVVKVPNMKYEDAVEYERALYKDEGTEKAEIVKHRKYNMKDVLSGVKVSNDFTNINATTLATKITAKTVSKVSDGN